MYILFNINIYAAYTFILNTIYSVYDTIGLYSIIRIEMILIWMYLVM